MGGERIQGPDGASWSIVGLAKDATWPAGDAAPVSLRVDGEVVHGG